MFTTIDYAVNEDLSINLGFRLTDEEKEIYLASINRNVSVGSSPPCSVPSGTCPFDYIDNDSWKTTSPKIGFTYNDVWLGLLNLVVNSEIALMYGYRWTNTRIWYEIRFKWLVHGCRCYKE